MSRQPAEGSAPSIAELSALCAVQVLGGIQPAAVHLGMSEPRVKQCLWIVRHKLGATSNGQAFVFAIQRGYIRVSRRGVKVA